MFGTSYNVRDLDDNSQQTIRFGLIRIVLLMVDQLVVKNNTK